MGVRRSLILTAITLLVVGLYTVPAHAAFFLIFETAAYQPERYEIPNTGGLGSPGRLVRARTGGRRAMQPNEVMPAFLAADGYPSTVESVSQLTDVDGLTPIGDLRSDRDGNGRLSFETPTVPPGDYEIVVYCRSCAPFSDGSNVVAIAPFRVTGEPRASDQLWIPITIGFLGLLVGFMIFRKRAGDSETVPEASL